ncbi:alpha-hydroxy-acid oxidizing protein [Streptomyces sp. RB110-1]|uniref:alpha-hydroxy-acid oxidizing protein n=1 Tax=unclassified Streptomyces TaxID=2593676 RepID=UPI0019004796|nr:MULTISPECIES: alpha-hydroxy-acid oxidizing protein [unclassified Streptomyces]MBK0373077.1 alpha-hydroxy-acid oxidizing protein [Streptomyces sp. RB110-1]MBK0390555.1 alpha-hydroxy-acid oxidizing protein [Streptomyces sp. RB110-2]
MKYLSSYQNQIFRRGSSASAALPFSPDAWERAARQALDGPAFDYIAGAAGRELTAAANTAAFERWGLMYRVLRDETLVDPSLTLLGTPMSMPVLLAPAGVADLAHPEGECAAARAAAGAGVTMVLSAGTSASMEDVADAAPEGRRWFQFAWSGDDRLARSLVARAEAAGYEAIMLMGDCYRAGWRPREMVSGFYPFRHGHGMGNYVSDPRFRELAGLDAAGAGLGNDIELAEAVVSTWNRVLTRPSLRARDLAVLRSWTKLPIAVKGVCRPDEAAELVDAGADAIVVSNHGGRQLDSGVAALDCLAPVVAAVEGRAPVLFDSGVRTGTDVLIALALGASAVMVGRPWLYGLAVGGQAGVEHVLHCLRAEFTDALALVGHRRCDTLNRGDLVRLDNSVAGS